jgi:hypothetical protein
MEGKTHIAQSRIDIVEQGLAFVQQFKVRLHNEDLRPVDRIGATSNNAALEALNVDLDQYVIEDIEAGRHVI